MHVYMTAKRVDQFFHIVEETDLRGQDRPVFVQVTRNACLESFLSQYIVKYWSVCLEVSNLLLQVRAKTEFAIGIWSELVSLSK